jgi:hypothetical protein
MTTPRDLDRLIRTYLQEDQVSGQAEVPVHVYSAIRHGIEQTRQKAVIGSLGVPEMNKFLALGLGAAAMVAALLIGANLLGSGNPPPGVAPSVSAVPSEPAPSVEPVGYSELPQGSLLLWDGTPDGVSITVTISADGWWGSPGLGWFTNDNEPHPPGRGMIVYGSVEEYYVYADPCHWRTTMPATPATTVDEVVAALKSQTSGTEDDHEPFGAWATEPSAISVDGYSGKSITLHAPDIFNHDCDLDQHAYFATEDESPARYLVRGGPEVAGMQGQNDEMWIVDVDGAVVVLDMGYDPSTPPAVVDELRAILESTTFD